MERRRRGITRPGVFSREWWYELSHVNGVAPWLDTLGMEEYDSSQKIVAVTQSVVEVTIVPHEKIITALWERGSAKAKPKLEQVEGTRPHPTRKTQTFRIEPGAGVTACEPRVASECDDPADDKPDKNPYQRVAIPKVQHLYSAVFVPGIGEKGQCQLRFDRQPDGSIRVALSSLENRRL